MPCTASYFKMDKYTGCYITPEYLFYNLLFHSYYGLNNTALTMNTNQLVEIEVVKVVEVSDLVKRI